jgi:hypothetical protein
MPKMVILGCSLSAEGHVPSWPNRVSEVAGLECYNLAVPASSNQLQIERFKEYILDNRLGKDDIVIWEITGTERGHQRIKFETSEKYIKETPHIMWNEEGMLLGTNCALPQRKNQFDSEYRLDYLCNHQITLKMKVDEAQLLEDILFFLTTARQYTKHLVVLIGWKEAISSKYYDQFISTLKERGFAYIDSHIMEHSIENNIPLDESLHPTKEGYFSYADNCVIPKLKELKVI